MIQNQVENIKSRIFKIKTDQELSEVALEVFRLQVNHNNVYRQFVNSLKIDLAKVKTLEQIPFLPIEFFKTHKILTGPDESKLVFKSSGTTGTSTSSHHITDEQIYIDSFSKGFELSYGAITDYTILALLPSYLEQGNSSLVYMADHLLKQTKKPGSGFYLNNYYELISTLEKLNSANEKVILIGVSYALLDLIDQKKFNLKNTIIIETGGMKGRRKELTREELHKELTEGFGVNEIHSEYGMTELLSQAYSKGNGIFETPPWMKILIRDVNDPFTFLEKKRTGGINIIDLANLNSCSFLATHDLGKLNDQNQFEVLGRFDNSDLRGCNLMIS